MNDQPAPGFGMGQQAFDKILQALLAKRTTLPCSRCGHNQFEIQPAYTTIPLVSDFSMASSYGPYVPCAVVACKNCGNLSFHSLAQLGLLNPEPGSEASQSSDVKDPL